MIEVCDIYKEFDKKNILNGISLTIKKGEIHGLIGENSAGKTTLIKSILGIYNIDKGRILCDDKIIFDNIEVKENIAYVADFNEYIPSYTVNGIIKLFKCYYDKFDEKRFIELNRIFKLNKRSIISTLSKGQKMQLAFMLAISQNSEYVLLDEPTSGLDVIAKRNLLDILVSEVEHRDIGVLISSHSLESLESTCDKITLIKDGVVTLQDDIDILKDIYTKVQVGFKSEIPKGIHNNPMFISVNNIGSIYTIVSKEPVDNLINELYNLGADFIEEIPLTLEEVYVYANGEGR